MIPGSLSEILKMLNNRASQFILISFGSSLQFSVLLSEQNFTF